jgi:SAM-dependent methyltransferase
MEFTGERYVPTHGSLIAYEHWHRYVVAGQFVAGKTVLDIASGEGYGSAYLAERAAKVVGVDVDPEAVQHAARTYARPNLEFRCGAAEAIPIEGERLFDVVVSFETIEHLWQSQQEQFLREVVRLLKPGGVVLISSPNKLLYSDKPRFQNAFHRREFYYDEFVSTLQAFFRHVHVLGQRVHFSSMVWPVTGSPSYQEFQLSAVNGRFAPIAEDKKAMLYFLAVCSDEVLDVPQASVLLDVSEQIADAPKERLRQELDAVLPRKTMLLVAAGGDDELLQLLGRPAAHFPQANGVYVAGPLSPQAAAGCLEELRRARGAQYLVVPSWTAEHLDPSWEFRQHLECRFDAVLAQEGLGIVYDIRRTRDENDSYRRFVERLRDAADAVLPPQAAVLVASAGDPELIALGDRPVEHFPQMEGGACTGMPLHALEAADQLEAMRQSFGFQYLLMPAWTAEYLDRGREFHHFLEGRFEAVLARGDVGFIYDLRHARGE